MVWLLQVVKSVNLNLLICCKKIKWDNILKSALWAINKKCSPNTMYVSLRASLQTTLERIDTFWGSLGAQCLFLLTQLLLVCQPPALLSG